MKASIQADAAECFAQLSLDNLGRQHLQQDTAALDALRQLVGEGWLSEEARRWAEGALIALDPQQKPSQHAMHTDQLHVMMSCAHPQPPLSSPLSSLPLYLWRFAPFIQMRVLGAL